MESINPPNGEVLRRFEALSAVRMRQRIALAAEAFRSYRTVPVASEAERRGECRVPGC